MERMLDALSVPWKASLGVAGSDSYLISAVTWRMDLVGMKKKRSRDQS